jgi:hypothetical protein
MSFISNLTSGGAKAQDTKQRTQAQTGFRGVPFAMPQQQSLGFPTWGTGALQFPQWGTGANSGQQSGGGGVQDPAAAARAAEAAQQAALRQGLQGTIGQLNSLYDNIFGDVRKVGQSQRQALDSRFNRETGALTDQFNQEMPKIGRSYAGRGAYDSSYRMDSEQAAQKGFENQIGDLKEQRIADAAKIGGFVSEQEARINAEKGMLQRTLGQLGDITDVGELRQLRNQIDRQLADTQASRGGLMSQEQLAARANKLAPAADRMSGLQSTLANIINGQAPGPLKRAVAQQIIGSAGLRPEEEQALMNQINSQIG